MNVLRLKLAGKQLSTPELVVLYGAARGLSAEETAAMLVKSRHTVITQRRSLQAKLGARNLTHAVALAYERGLFNEPAELSRLLRLDPAGTVDGCNDADADAPSYHERS